MKRPIFQMVAVVSLALAGPAAAGDARWLALDSAAREMIDLLAAERCETQNATSFDQLTAAQKAPCRREAMDTLGLDHPEPRATNSSRDV